MTEALSRLRDSLDDRISRLETRVLLLQTDPRDVEAGRALVGELRLLESECEGSGAREAARVAAAAATLAQGLLDARRAPRGEYESLLFGAFESAALLVRERSDGVPSGLSGERVAGELEAAAEGVAPEVRTIEADPDVAPLPAKLSSGPGPAAAAGEPPVRRKPLAPPSANEPTSAAPPLSAPATQGPAGLGLDTSRFLGKFRDATVDHIQKLNEDLLLLEKDPAGDEERVREVMREIHTLKGESRMMGFADISSLAHATEDLLKSLRDGGFRRLTEWSDHLFGAFDALLALTREKTDAVPAGVDVADLCASLRRAAAEAAGPGAPARATVAPPPERRPVPAAPAVASAAPAAPPKPAGEGPAFGRITIPGMHLPAAAAESGARTGTDATIRVAIEKLDALAGVTGDLFLLQTGLAGLPARLRSVLEVIKTQERTAARLREVIAGGALAERVSDDALVALDDLEEAGESLRRRVVSLVKEEREASLRTTLAVGDLRERVQEIRMLPVATLFDFYPRIVRDMAREFGKDVGLEIEGRETEIDRKILEALRDPLVHLIRNALDHGIGQPEERERAGKPRQGTVRLRAAREGDRIFLSVSDDGRGMDPKSLRAAAVRKGFLDAAEAEALDDAAALDLVFLSGFSSREEVTDWSGRGVGMDVVREHVTRLKGTIHVDSRPGRGTTFTLRLPLTLSVARVLLVRAGEDLVALPSERVREVGRYGRDRVEATGAESALRTPQGRLPLVPLARLLGAPSVAKPARRLTIVVLEEEEGSVALLVEALVGERELIVKGLGPFLGRIPIVSGASVLPTGEVALLLSPGELVRAAVREAAAVARVAEAPRLAEPEEAGPTASAPAREPRAGAGRRILVAEESIVLRDLLVRLLEGAGYDVLAVPDGEAALERLRREPFAAVVASARMPIVEGADLLRRLPRAPDREATPAVILLVDDAASTSEREELRSLGARQLVSRGRFDPAALLAALSGIFPSPHR